MLKKCFNEVSTDCPVEIMGHVFEDLAAIICAVGKSARILEPLYHKRDVFDSVAEGCPDGMYVLKLYNPYPCFDSDDYVSEDRDYCNFFFSDVPFTDDMIDELARVRPGMNSCIVNERMPEWAFPAVYYSGTGKHMLLATLE